MIRQEGFTVFVERKIIGRLFGKQRRQFESILGNTALKQSVDHYGTSHQFTTLIPNLHEADPDDVRGRLLSLSLSLSLSPTLPC